MSLSLELLPAAKEGDPQATTKILEENTGLIWSVIRRYFGRGVETDDLYQLGCLGFLKALRGFDPGYGTQFSTYAVPKIAGEVRRFLRDDGAVKVSRSLKEQGLAIKLARGRLSTTLGREPTLSELAQETGFQMEEIATAESATEPVTSLHAETGEGMTLESLLTRGNEEDANVEKIALRTAMEQLPENQKTVLLLRYYKGLTQVASAKIMAISQVQVSRLERRAIATLREQLNSE